VGEQFHMDPQVPHYFDEDARTEMVPGMTFTIEPMINAGKPQTKQLPDGWTVVTKDHSLSAQWEHTIAVTEDGFEILTQWPDA
jgi:methionyl aminopeptidase